MNHTGNGNIYIYIRYMYLVFTQISHIQSHLQELIAQPAPCFCLVFTTRGVGETGGGEGKTPFQSPCRWNMK